MKMRNTLSALALAVGTAAVAAIAQADVYVYDGTIMPPQVVGVIPSHGFGYVYGPGRYVWDGTHYVWIGASPLGTGDNTYDRWSWVPDDYVHIPEAFLKPNDFVKGG